MTTTSYTVRPKPRPFDPDMVITAPRITAVQTGETLVDETPDIGSTIMALPAGATRQRKYRVIRRVRGERTRGMKTVGSDCTEVLVDEEVYEVQPVRRAPRKQTHRCLVCGRPAAYSSSAGWVCADHYDEME